MPQTDAVAAPEPGTGSGAGTAPSPTRAGPLKSAGAALARYAGVLPFFVYVALGLLIPVVAIIVGAFQAPGTGALTTANLDTATHGVYLQGFKESLLLSVLASVIPGILGLLIAYAIFTAKRGRVLRQVVITASGVFANFGGVPLAFLFITTLGSSGLETQWLKNLGWDIYGGGFSPMADSQPVAIPVVPRVAMNRNASGTPPKLANVPEAVIVTRRSIEPRRAVKIAYAIRNPMMPGIIAVITDSSRLTSRPCRYTPCRAVLMLLRVQAPSSVWNAPMMIAIVGRIRPSPT